MECAAVPIAAISTGNKVGLAVAAVVFIVFSLVSALVIPRRKPDFPGGARGLFIFVTLLLFVGMMTAVFVFGKESEESEAHEPPSAETTTGTTAEAGDAAAGKQVFASAGCGACHTFEPAGSTATVGPDLDTALQGKDAEFVRASIVDPNAEIAPGFQPNVMPQNLGEQLSDKQLSDLVAFLESG
jgi:mono/diheme cytochrome c family protein